MLLVDDAELDARRTAHEARVDAWIGPHLERRSAAGRHPVEDFLFTYYSNRPSALRAWHPGVGSCVVGRRAADFDGRKGYVVEDGRAFVAPVGNQSRREAVGWIRDLLEATAARPTALGCFGLHEWAMVYRQPADDVRHGGYPLRLGARGTDEVVESHRIACTHYDAFRFFTDAARPLNLLQPTRTAQAETDQPGCLHATMDVYKWAYKLAPLTPSELVADCFELARDVRAVDMRASPYDLSALGYPPIAIETPAGKAEYVRLQRGFAERAAPLRSRLVEVCAAALDAADDSVGAAVGTPR